MYKAAEGRALLEEFAKGLQAEASPKNGQAIEKPPTELPKEATLNIVRDTMRELGYSIRWNVITGCVEVHGLPKLFSIGNAVNTLPVLLRDTLKQRGCRCSALDMNDYLSVLADENRFNPVADMLTGTIHDGKDRIVELHDILGIKMGSRDSNLFIKWLWQCVAMALNDDDNPAGADGVLVLQGPQGCGKTRFFSVLSVKPDWFAEGVSIDTDQKDTIIQATGCWIAELGELDATLKRDQSSLKAFLTSSRDTYRLPYARAAVKRARRTSFCATVNPDGFLNDETGSRRYWVVPVTKIDVPKLLTLTSEWLAQFWRQVYEDFYLHNPQGFRLTQEERSSLLEANQMYTKLLPFEIEVRDLFDWDMPAGDWSWFKSSEVKDRIGGRAATAEQIGRVLSKLMREDARILRRQPKGVYRYLLPLRRVC